MPFTQLFKILLNFLFTFLPAVRAGSGDRGAAATGRLPERDPGPQSPGHGAQHSLRRGGMFGGVPPTPVQRVSGWEQACQRRASQRSVVLLQIQHQGSLEMSHLTT